MQPGTFFFGDPFGRVFDYHRRGERKKGEDKAWDEGKQKKKKKKKSYRSTRPVHHKYYTPPPSPPTPHLPLVKNEDLVGAADGGQSVCDDDGRAVRLEPVQCLLHPLLRNTESRD